MSPEGAVVAETAADLETMRPGPLMSEQDPDAWWSATEKTIGELREFCPMVRGIGLSGQMHGAVLLGADGKPLRPAILWNDGRSAEECVELEDQVRLRDLTGNCAMPGFTAPKLMWTKKHEPNVFKQINMVLLPKDYVRLKMIGTHATDMSDASGTLWLNVRERRWDDTVLAATELDRSNMPALFEGSDVTGVLLSDLANRWNMRQVPVVGGAGDQAAGAVGAGAVESGYCTLSLGTSGVLFIPDSQYRANPDGGIHTFCHALPETWHQMAVILSAAGSLEWVSQLTGRHNIQEFVADIEQSTTTPDQPMFLPYLSGERTPHNDPLAQGAFVGLTLDTTATSLGHAVLEGVALALRDCQNALADAGTQVSNVNVIGGGTKSIYWGQLIANALEIPITYRKDAAVGPALGAARLAQLGTEGLSVNEVCAEAQVEQVIEPEQGKLAYYRERYAIFGALYRDLKQRFGEIHHTATRSK